MALAPPATKSRAKKLKSSFQGSAAQLSGAGSGINGDYRVFFKHDELRKLYGGAGLTIVRYEEPVAPADFTKQTPRLVRLVAQKPRL